MDRKNKNKKVIPFTFLSKNPVRGLFTLASRQPDRLCMVEPRGNMVRNYTYAELTEEIERVSRAVAATKTQGQQKPIAMIVHSSFRAIVANIAALLAGARLVVIPTHATQEEQLQILADNHIELLIMDDLRASEELLSQIPFLPDLRQLWSLEDEPSLYHSEISTLGWEDIALLAASKKSQQEKMLEELDDHTPICRFYQRNAEDEFEYSDYSMERLARAVYRLRDRAEHEFSDLKRQAQRILSMIPFNRAPSHIAGMYLPLLTGQVMMAVDREEAWKSGALPYDPDFLVASSRFLTHAADHVKSELLAHRSLTGWLLTQQMKVTSPEGLAFSMRASLLRMLTKTAWKDSLGGHIQAVLLVDEALPESVAHFCKAVKLSVMLPKMEELPPAKLAKDIAKDISFHSVRGVQLAENEDLKQIKIVGS